MTCRSKPFAGAAILLAFVAIGALAQDEPKSGCINDVVGQLVCSPPGGSIAKDATGRPVCGLGQCLKSALSQYVCSSQPGGYAALDVVRRIVCTGGCQPASESLCQRPS